MVYVFYVFGLISFALSNLTGFLTIAQNFDIGVYEALMISSLINGFLYGAVFRWVVTTHLLATIEELLNYIHPIRIETNQPKKQKKEKSEFSESHREKLRLNSMKRTRDANGRFK